MKYKQGIISVACPNIITLIKFHFKWKVPKLELTNSGIIGKTYGKAKCSGSFSGADPGSGCGATLKDEAEVLAEGAAFSV